MDWEEVATEMQTNLENATEDLMPALDEQADTHIILLERAQDPIPIPDGAVRLHATKRVWFGAVVQLAELAQAIIVVLGASSGLIEEVEYLSGAGLNDRTLFYSKGRLMILGPDAPKKWWPNDRFGEAVAYAAAQPATEGSDAFIRDPLLPEWFVRGYDPAAGGPDSQ